MSLLQTRTLPTVPPLQVLLSQTKTCELRTAFDDISHLLILTAFEHLSIPSRMIGRVERFFQFPALDIIIGRDLQAFSQGMQFLNRMRPGDEVVQFCKYTSKKLWGGKEERIESALVPRYTDHTHRQDARTKELPGFAFFSACESTATTHDTTSFPLFKHILGLE